MAQSFDSLKPFTWARGGGKLTELGRGIIFGLHLAGVPATRIEKCMHIHRKYVYQAIRDAKVAVGAEKSPDGVEGCEGLSDSEEKSTPNKRSRYSEEKEEMLDRIDGLMYERNDDGKYVVTHARDVRRILFAEEPNVGRNVPSLRTIQRYLGDLGHENRPMPVKPGMKPRHVKQRLELGPELLELDPTKIIFSDECHIDCNIYRRRTWKRDGEAIEERPVERWTSKCHVWGAIGVDFCVLKILEGTVTALSYSELLKKELIPKLKEDHIFMQDGASSHTSKLAKLALKDVRVVNWPAKSPDLNPIERLWNVLKGRIDVDLYATPDELHNAVIAAWDSITQEEINALVLTFHSSVRKMIAAEGKA